MINKILVPIDGSEHSRKALDFACELALKFGSQLHLLYVVQPPISTQTIGARTTFVRTDFRHNDIQEIGINTIEAAKRITREHECTNVETQIEAGSPTYHILSCARKNKADLIVMGSRGLTDIAGLLLGSVSHKVTHLAECNCVTIR